MSDGILTKCGKLKKKFLPAIYFDSSVLIDYWLTEGMENWTEDDYREWEKNEPKANIVIREIFKKSDMKLQNITKIRQRLYYDKLRAIPVVTPLSILELMEWNAENAFRQYASDAVGAMLIRSRGKKDIGDCLIRALNMRKEEMKQVKEEYITDKNGNVVAIKGRHSTGLETFMSDAWLNRSFAECHGLQGLLQADIVNFELTIDKIWHEPSVYAYLQIGLSDTMHVLVAQHLGCEYIASFDSDFKRAKDIIKEENGMVLLSSPEEILEIL